MPKVKTSCEVCGKEIEFFPSHKRRFCSNSCSAHATGKLRAQRGDNPFTPYPLTGETLTCKTCGKAFYAQAWTLKRNRAYCSKECRGIADRVVRSNKSCEYCGAEMHLKPSGLDRKYCSRSCLALGKTKHLTGEMHNGKPIKRKHGYLFAWEPDNPNKNWQGWQPVHRIVVEKMLGRYLERGEHVHHINGIKDDNREENLQVLLQAEHAALSIKEYGDFVKRELAELTEYRRRFGPLN